MASCQAIVAVGEARAIGNRQTAGSMYREVHQDNCATNDGSGMSVFVATVKDMKAMDIKFKKWCGKDSARTSEICDGIIRT